MQRSFLLRGLLVVLAVTVAAALPGCKKKSPSGTTDVTAEANAVEVNISRDEALTEQNDAGTVTWVVSPDGQVRARFKTPDGALIKSGVSGTLTVKGLKKGDKPVTVKLEPDANTGLYVATIPKLGADLTEVGYEIDVNGKPVKGAMHLPRGGTKALVTTARAAAENKLPEGKKGPHGGVVQVVGSDILEIAADEKTNQVRVYALNDDLKPVAVGKRRVKLGVVSSTPEMIELEAEPKQMYFTGKLSVKANPTKLTVALYEDDAPEPVVVLCGWHPGAVIVVGAGAPVLLLFAIASWPDVVIIDPRPVIIVTGKGKGKHRFKLH
jgi:hypothetical protein